MGTQRAIATLLFSVLVLIVFWLGVWWVIDITFPPRPDGWYDWPSVVKTIHPDDPYAGRYISFDEAYLLVEAVTAQSPSSECYQDVLC